MNTDALMLPAHRPDPSSTPWNGRFVYTQAPDVLLPINIGHSFPHVTPLEWPIALYKVYLLSGSIRVVGAGPRVGP